MLKPIEQVVTFVRESKEELKKVTWPDKDEVTSFTFVVVVAVAIVSVFLWLVDTILMSFITKVMY